MKRFRSIFLFTLILMRYVPSTLHAALFEQLAVSALGGSMGNAVTAYPAGAMSIHYNPAGLADIPGTRFDNGLGIVETYREVSFRQAIDPITGKLWAPSVRITFLGSTMG